MAEDVAEMNGESMLNTLRFLIDNIERQMHTGDVPESEFRTRIQFAISLFEAPLPPS